MYKPRITGGKHIFMFNLGGLETAQDTCPCSVAVLGFKTLHECLQLVLTKIWNTNWMVKNKCKQFENQTNLHPTIIVTLFSVGPFLNKLPRSRTRSFPGSLPTFLMWHKGLQALMISRDMLSGDICPCEANSYGIRTNRKARWDS